MTAAIEAILYALIAVVGAIVLTWPIGRDAVMEITEGQRNLLNELARLAQRDARRHHVAAAFHRELCDQDIRYARVAKLYADQSAQAARRARIALGFEE